MPMIVRTGSNAKKTYYNTDKDKIWTVVGETQGIELDETQKEIALSVVCGGEYDIDDIVYIRVTEDLSAGWAFTKDSFCATHNDGSIIIPYKFIKIEKREQEAGEEGEETNYFYYLLNTDTKEEWSFYRAEYNKVIAKMSIIFGGDAHAYSYDINPLFDRDSAETIVKCLNTMKNLFKKK